MMRSKKWLISAPLRSRNLELKIKKLRRAGAAARPVDNLPAFDTRRIVAAGREADGPRGPEFLF
jgi:hypothetical protein